LGVLMFCGISFCLSAGGVGLYAASPPDVTNILILGSDARPNTAEEQIARTDSIMVLSINPNNQSISLFSVPRDVFIQSPRFGWLRANTVVRNAELNREGSGIDEMIAAMEGTFDIQIDGYMRVSFESFVALVDAVGGITINVPKYIVDNEYPTYDYGMMRIEFFAGEQQMDGETALIYARTRHGDDDYNRAARQQQVVEAVISKLLSPATIDNYPTAINAIFSNMETDVNIAEWMSHSPGFLLYGNHVNQFVVDRNYILARNGAAYPNTQTLEPWIAEYMR